MAKHTKLLATILLLTIFSGLFLPNFFGHGGSSADGKTTAAGIMQSDSESFSLDSDDKNDSIHLHLVKHSPEIVLCTVMFLLTLTIIIYRRLQFSMAVFYQSNYVILAP
ncbi:hypothetical protein [Mesobacillus foraminis]|uniref:Transmembrane protein n=1 Tax=Mesobacillus foraminis TaxID=279826 RepID=A0A4R2B9V7_9BACI|nr:hypothetical protein [Mesobacillus foraminis]TCN22364.1 hypothetical protein EV146_111205 [Mesobacillus foraminis]